MHQLFKRLLRRMEKVFINTKWLKISQAKELLYLHHHQQYCSLVTSCLKSRLEWSDLDLIRDIIVVRETQGWQKILDEEESSHSVRESISHLAQRFKIPLNNSGVDIDKLSEVLHSTQFISLSTMTYQAE